MSSGGDCSVANTYCGEGSCFQGSCKTELSLGGDCSNTLTTTCGAAECVYDNVKKTKVCKTKLSLGGDCSDANTYCGEGTCFKGSCKTELSLGGVCSNTLTTTCVAADCVYDDAKKTKVCKTLLSLGGDCTDANTYCGAAGCVYDPAINLSVCKTKTLLPFGGDCSDPSTTTCGAELACDLSFDKICKKSINTGAHCTWNSPTTTCGLGDLCTPDYYDIRYDSEKYSCRTLLFLNDECSDDNEFTETVCSPNLVCFNSRCKKKVYHLQDCSDKDSACFSELLCEKTSLDESTPPVCKGQRPPGTSCLDILNNYKSDVTCGYGSKCIERFPNWAYCMTETALGGDCSDALMSYCGEGTCVPINTDLNVHNAGKCLN